MPSTHKKVIVRRWTGIRSPAMSRPRSSSRGQTRIGSNTAGNVVAMDLREIKGRLLRAGVRRLRIAYPQDFHRRSPLRRLWVRLRFKTMEILEGLMPAGPDQTTPEGFLINLPTQRSKHAANLRPRTALESLTVLAVIVALRRSHPWSVADSAGR